MTYELATGYDYYGDPGDQLSLAIYLCLGLFITGIAIFLNSPYYVRVVSGLLNDPVVMENERLVWALRLLMSYFILSGSGGVIVAFVAVYAGVTLIAIAAALAALFVWFALLTAQYS